MKILDIHNNAVKPKLYEKGNAVMWTDKHISKQLLDVHLNTDVDLGSRKIKTINSTVTWILKTSKKKKLNILDLGCGPGLYSEKLAQKGHNVTGVDFSANSIAYAKEEAKKKKLDIIYLKENYLNLDLEENSFVYEENKVILYQHIVIDTKETISVYRFWTHFFSQSDLSKILHTHDFIDLSYHEDILPKGDLWNGDNVTFCKAINSK